MRFLIVLCALLCSQHVAGFGIPALPRRLVHQDDPQRILPLPDTIERRAHVKTKTHAPKHAAHKSAHLHKQTKRSTKPPAQKVTSHPTTTAHHTTTTTHHVTTTHHTTPAHATTTKKQPQSAAKTTPTTPKTTAPKTSAVQKTTSPKVTVVTTKHATSTTLSPATGHLSSPAHVSSAPPKATSSPATTGCVKVPGGINSVSSTPGGGVITVTQTADGPAPSRSAVACVAAPSSFAGTQDGYTGLCAGTRYCDPKAAHGMSWQGPDGDVTRVEIESLIGELQSTGTHLINGGDANALSDGWLGLASYGAGLLFEATYDRRALDVAVRIADNILISRNDPNTGRVMWNGLRSPIWPTKAENGDTATYYGCESMHVVGHMVNVAIYILKTPCLWGLSPQLTSGPTPFGANATYLQRAQAYVAAGDQTVQQAYLPYFFNSAGLMIQPTSPLYAQAHDFPPGTWMPWNRRSMMLHGLIRLATAHTLAPVQDAGLVSQYEGIIDANVRDFVSVLTPTTAQGHSTYTWTYARKPPGGSIEMVNGIHAYYDIWGMWIAWQHGAAPDALTNTVMTNFANTMQYQIYQADQKNFAAYVSGESNPCDTKEAPRTSLWGGWSFYGLFVPQWYQTVAAADTSSMTSIWTSSTLFWAKAAMHRANNAFWKSQYSTGAMPVQIVG